jgi:hypothetical protein
MIAQPSFGPTVAHVEPEHRSIDPKAREAARRQYATAFERIFDGENVSSNASNCFDVESGRRAIGLFPD